MKKRLTAFLLALCLLLAGSGARVYYIAASDTYSAADSYNSYSLTIEKLYTTIMDRNGAPLTNYKMEYVAIIKPNEKCMSELPKLFDQAQIQEITDELSNGYPLLVPVDKYTQTKYIQIVDRVVQNPQGMPCRQLLDFTCSGLEAYTNAVVRETKINFAVDALGRVLTGDSAELTVDSTGAAETLKTTLDRQVQLAAEKAAKQMKQGAVVVLDAQSGELLASVSKPDDYYNRALSPYCIGSVFKLIVAACALENDQNPTYTCKGSITVGDTTYSCQKDHVHGKETIEKALANSCNCYFVNLALSLGRERLRKTAADFGFGGKTQLYKDWQVSNGNLPSDSVLLSDGQLALLGFGQGSLTDTPLHFSRCVAAIANGGLYKAPPLAGQKNTKSVRVLSEKNAKKLLSYMRTVVESGTGSYADYQKKSAGKTATAQSGQYKDGREILYTYFAGVYPYDSPEYAIVIMTEDGRSGSLDCCPIFKSLVEMLSRL